MSGILGGTDEKIPANHLAVASIRLNNNIKTSGSVEYKRQNGQSYWVCEKCNGEKLYSFPTDCTDCIKKLQSKYNCGKCGQFVEEHRIFSDGSIICRYCYEELYGQHAVVILLQQILEELRFQSEPIDKLADKLADNLG